MSSPRNWERYEGTFGEPSPECEITQTSGARKMCAGTEYDSPHSCPQPGPHDVQTRPPMMNTYFEPCDAWDVAQPLPHNAAAGPSCVCVCVMSWPPEVLTETIVYRIAVLGGLGRRHKLAPGVPGLPVLARSAMFATYPFLLVYVSCRCPSCCL